jgi:hypothetical protein
MPDYLPMKKIKVEISSFDSNFWIYIPKPMKTNDDNDKKVKIDIERDPFPLIHVKKSVLNSSFFGFCKVPLEMDKRIVESGIKVLEYNQESKTNRQLEKIEKAYREEIKERLKRQQSLEGKMDKIEHKLDKMEQNIENILNQIIS